MGDLDVIVRDPAICGEEPTIRGTRVTLRTILASLAEGDEGATILGDYPTLTPGDIRAAIRFAAASARDDMPIRGLPSSP